MAEAAPLSDSAQDAAIFAMDPRSAVAGSLASAAALGLVNDLGRLPQGDPLPRRFLGWFFLISGIVNVAFGALILLRGNTQGLWPLVLMLPLLVFGIAELTGALSRWRWRAAARRLAARSTPAVVRWRYEGQVIIGMFLLLPLAGAAGLVLLLAHLPWPRFFGAMLAVLVGLGALYSFLRLLVNTRSIACSDGELVYSSGPLPLRRPRLFAALKVVVLPAPDSSLGLYALTETGLKLVASTCTIELAVCIAGEVNARLASSRALSSQGLTTSRAVPEKVGLEP